MTDLPFVRLSDQPWWTPADAAELDLLVHELVKVAFIHREKCGACSAGRGQECPGMLDAIEAVLEWKAARILRSKAAWLRELELQREALLGEEVSGRAA